MNVWHIEDVSKENKNKLIIWGVYTPQIWKTLFIDNLRIVERNNHGRQKVPIEIELSIAEYRYISARN